jgi:hypothetical protein
MQARSGVQTIRPRHKPMFHLLFLTPLSGRVILDVMGLYRYRHIIPSMEGFTVPGAAISMSRFPGQVVHMGGGAWCILGPMQMEAK